MPSGEQETLLKFKADASEVKQAAEAAVKALSEVEQAAQEQAASTAERSASGVAQTEKEAAALENVGDKAEGAAVGSKKFEQALRSVNPMLGELANLAGDGGGRESSLRPGAHRPPASRPVPRSGLPGLTGTRYRPVIGGGGAGSGKRQSERG